VSKFILIFTLFFFSLTSFCQTGPPPSPPPPQTVAPSPPEPKELFENSQNNIMGTQSKSFGGGSIIKPNPMYTFADFALIGSPTYESFSFRPGTGIGYSRFKDFNTFGGNAMLTFDLSQQSYSVYYNKLLWYYHLNLGRMTTTQNIGASVTRIFRTKGIIYGIQLGGSILEDHKYVYFILVPYSVLMANTEIRISKRVKWKPETFVTLSSPYFDLGKNYRSVSNTFNSVVGNNISIRITKSFVFNINYRMNVNTTPKFGIMHNILLGANLDF
jgi:hypothetical protein